MYTRVQSSAPTKSQSTQEWGTKRLATVHFDSFDCFECALTHTHPIEMQCNTQQHLSTAIKHSMHFAVYVKRREECLSNWQKCHFWFGEMPFKLEKRLCPSWRCQAKFKKLHCNLAYSDSWIIFCCPFLAFSFLSLLTYRRWIASMHKQWEMRTFFFSLRMGTESLRWNEILERSTDGDTAFIYDISLSLLIGLNNMNGEMSSSNETWTTRLT